MDTDEIDLDAALWLIENGTVLSKELVVRIINEAKGWRAIMDDYRRNGCGYRECGMAESGFSNWDN